MLERVPFGVAIVVAALVGLAVGVGGYTFVYARGLSYLTDEPGACANCHAMRDEYATWTASTHHAVAACNDCHTPHNVVWKYVTKATNGVRHSVAFTIGRVPDAIQITTPDRHVTESACRDCHRDMVHVIDRTLGSRDELPCVQCHAAVGHAS